MQKRSQKIQSIQDKRRNMQKESAAAQGEMRTIRQEIDRNNASEVLDCCLDSMVEQIFAMGTDQASTEPVALCQIFLNRFETSTPPAEMPGKGGRRNSEDEQEQGKTSQQLGDANVRRLNEGTPTSSMELDLPRVRCAHSEGKFRCREGAKKTLIQFSQEDTLL